MFFIFSPFGTAVSSIVRDPALGSKSSVLIDTDSAVIVEHDVVDVWLDVNSLIVIVVWLSINVLFVVSDGLNKPWRKYKGYMDRNQLL